MLLWVMTEIEEIKEIIESFDVKSIDDIEVGTDVYDELFGYYMESGEMPYGVMKARTGDPCEWICMRLEDLGVFDDMEWEQERANHMAKSYARGEL